MPKIFSYNISFWTLHQMGPKYHFLFNSQEYRKNNSTVPQIHFTCSTFDNTTLPPYLKFCLRLTTFLRNQKGIEHFLEPVSELVTGYYDVIKHPMCISMIEKKIYEGQYDGIESFRKDVDLIWKNCMTFNSIGHVLTQIGLGIKAAFDEIFELHKKIIDTSPAFAALEIMDEAYNLSENHFNLSHSSMQKFRMPPHPKVVFTKLKQTQNERAMKTPKSTNEKEDIGYTKPSLDLLNTPMTTKEKYDLAKYIDTLPPELLGKVITILSEKFEIPKDREINIQFSDIDNATLRNIEAYIKSAKDKEQLVRRMYQSETKSAEKQLEILNEELKKINAKLEEKRPNSRLDTRTDSTKTNTAMTTSASSDTNSETETSTDSETSSSEDEG